MLKYHLAKAQKRMKVQADEQRADRVFTPGDWVFVKLQPYRQHYVAHRSNQKLAAKFFGPFQIISTVGTVAYKLQPPSSSQIHPVFHVSQLRKQVGPKPVQSTLPDVDDQGMLMAEPVVMLDRKLAKKGL